MKLLATIVLASLAGAATAQQTDQQPPEVTPLAENTFNLDWDGIHGRTYFIQFSTDLVDWHYMPVIESGQGVPLGYGFDCDGSRMFLRLKYTDQPTTTPHSDDFDGDSISNWDEIRSGGTGTDPFEWDTDGDGKSDYFADTDSNGVADGWELLYYGETGVVDPDADPDNDDQTNAQESWLGTSPNAHANTNDQDNDGLVDAVDAVPDDALINWPKTPVPHYAYVHLGQFSNLSWTKGLAVSEAGHVLAVAAHTNVEWLYFRSYVWQPDTGTWSGPLSRTDSNGTVGDYIRGTDVGADGRVIGVACVEEGAQGGCYGDGKVYYSTVEWADASEQPQFASGDRLSNCPLGVPRGYYYVMPPAFSPDGAMLSMDRGGYYENASTFPGSIAHAPTPVKLGGKELDVCYVQEPISLGMLGITNHFGRPGKGNLVTMTRVESHYDHGLKQDVYEAKGVYLFRDGTRETVDSAENRRAEAVARMPDAGGIPGAGRLLVTGTHTWIKQGGEWHQTRRRMSGWAVTPRGIILTGRKGESNKLWVNGREYTVEELCPQLSGNGLNNHVADINDSGVMLCNSSDMFGQDNKVGLLVPVDIATDLNNDGKINLADNKLRDAALASGASDEKIEKGTEYLFVNDNLSNGLWDKEDSDPDKPAAEKDDDDAQEISIDVPDIDGMEVWLEHPFIDGFSFYTSKECNAVDIVTLSPSQKFTVSETNPFPEKLFIRADKITLGSGGTSELLDANNYQIDGDLVLKIRIGGASGQEIEAIRIRLTLVEKVGAEKYFNAVRDYILENNTTLYVDDRPFINNNNVSVIRMCSMLEEQTEMNPFESYHDDARENWIQGGLLLGVPFEPDKFTSFGLGISGAMNSDPDSTVVINGNQCDFTRTSLPNPLDPLGPQKRLADLTAQSLLGVANLTDKCHGRIFTIPPGWPVSRQNMSSSDHDDPNSLVAGTHFRGSYLAGDDPVAGTAITGGKYFAQYTDGSYKMDAGRVAVPVFGAPEISGAIGGLSGNYSSGDRNNYPNSFVGYHPMKMHGVEGKGVVFVAMGKSTFDEGKVTEFYNAVKSSGVPVIPGASVDSAGLEVINLLMLDSGDTSCALAHKKPNGNFKKVFEGSKHRGFPYYTNTFLRFKSSKPRN